MSANESKKGKGRPPIPIDEKILKKLAENLLNDVTISRILGISEDTLHRRYADKIDYWRSNTDAKIAEMFLEEGLVERKEWASKLLVQNRLGFHDRVKSQNDNVNINLNADISETELDQVLNETMKALKSSDVE